MIIIKARTRCTDWVEVDKAPNMEEARKIASKILKEDSSVEIMFETTGE